MTTTTDPAAARAALAAMRGRARSGYEFQPNRFGRDILREEALRRDNRALLSVAEAAAGLPRLWWRLRSDDMTMGWCVVCRAMTPLSIGRAEPDWAAMGHSPDCYALRLDRALAALAAGGETGEVKEDPAP